MLMTPMRPKMMARPSAASANTNVIKVESITTLSAVFTGRILGVTALRTQKRAERMSSLSTSERQAFTARVSRSNRIEMLHFLKHVANPCPALADFHQVRWQYHLVVPCPHGDLALRSLV